MNLDDIIQLIIVIIAMGGGLIAQLIQGKKRAARRARRQAHRTPSRRVTPTGGALAGPGGRPGEDEIARRVREMLERAAGRKPAPPPEAAPRVEPPPPAAPPEPRPSYSRDTKVRKGFQQEGKAMGGEFRVFPPSGISEGPGRGGKKRKKKAPGAAKKAKAPAALPAAAAARLDAAALAVLLRSRPELGILGYEILGPPPALREKPPSWEWW